MRKGGGIIHLTLLQISFVCRGLSIALVSYLKVWLSILLNVHILLNLVRHGFALVMYR